MAQNKKHLFEKDLRLLAEYAKALSHPARLLILKTLARRGECICGEMVQISPLAQPTVSQHLAALKKAGFIKGTIDGPRSCYCINREGFNRAGAQFNRMFAELSKHKTMAKCC